jgi:two-component system, chemotaxis family, protein-glutamate methylesterase/glutaminase
VADLRTIVIGASAGGVDALVQLMHDLPADLNACVLVVLHVPATGTSVLPSILDRAGAMEASSAQDGTELAAGRVFVAPPDAHLTISDGQMNLGHGAKENGHRPAIDPLFRSVAEARGSAAIGVILSGALDDGAVGLAVLKEAGGIAVVQDPDDALYPSMPQSALAAVTPDHVVPIAEMADLLCRLVATDPPVRPDGDVGPTAAQEEGEAGDFGEATGLTCPECGGSIWEVGEGAALRYRCRVGHAYSPTTMLAAQGGQLEAALWVAVRSLEERTDLLRRLGGRLPPGSRSRQRFEAEAGRLADEAELIRQQVSLLAASTPEADVAVFSEATT